MNSLTNEKQLTSELQTTRELQTILLTSHKGVDLHAASALLVMKERLAGGDKLENLFRSELHTYWGSPEGWTKERLMATGRFFNPNKHHYGLFSGSGAGPDWFGSGNAGQRLPAGWLGSVLETDLEGAGVDGAALFGMLLGGRVPAGCSAFDIVSFAYGQEGPVLSGVLWRVVVRGDAADAAQVGEKLAVASHRKQGLLVNPHMENWFVANRTA